MHSTTLTEVMALIARASWHATVVAALIVLIQWALRKQLSPAMRYALWFVLLARLAVPHLPQTPWSMFNLARLGPALTRPESAAPAQLGSARLALNATARPRSKVGTASGQVHFTLAPYFNARERDQSERTRISPLAIPPASTAPSTPHPSRRALAITFVLSCIWLAGMASLAIRLAWQTVAFAARLRAARPVRDLSIRSNLESCARSIGLCRAPVLLETDAVGNPALYGLWHPCLLLPVGLSDTLSRAEMRFVFLHELAHLKRRDMAVNWLLALFGIVHWFNPVLWFAFGRMRADRELACDALALSRAGEGENQAYGATLIKILSGVSRPAATAGLVGIGEDMRQMKVRLTMIRQFRKTSAQPLLPLLAGLALAAATLTDAQIAPPAPSSLRAEDSPVASPPVEPPPAGPSRPGPAKTADPNRAATAADSTQIEDVRLLIEMGKLDEAEAKLERLSRNPEDREVLYYLSVIKEARYAQESRRREIAAKLVQAEKAGNPSAVRERSSNEKAFTRTNYFHTSPGRQAIYHKLDQIVLKEVVYDGLPLSEVVRDLNEQSRLHDPDKLGVNIIINPHPAASREAQSVGGVDFVGGQAATAAGETRVNVNDAIIRLHLVNVRLADIIDAVSKVAETPLKYSVEDYAVVFAERGNEPQQLFTRVYHVDPNSLLEGLNAFARVGGGTASSDATIETWKVPVASDLTAGDLGSSGLNLTNRPRATIIEQIRKFFAAAGVDFSTNRVAVGAPGLSQPSGKALFFNDRTGLLLVRATMGELDIIEKAVQVLNSAPPQVAIAAKLIDLPAGAEPSQLGFDWLLGQNPPPTTPHQGVQPGPELSKGGGTFPNPSASSQAVPRSGATGILTIPQTSVLLRALEQRAGAKTIANPTVTTLSGRQIRTEIPGAGFSLDVLPRVMADGNSVQLDVDFRLNPLGGEGEAADHERKPLRAATSTLVWDGQTLLLGPFPVGEGKSTGRVLLLVTPTVVDPAGNPVHGAGEQPWNPK
jgi:beta-lactamase regulating signal transducer with metallopeptidase domain